MNTDQLIAEIEQGAKWDREDREEARQEQARQVAFAKKWRFISPVLKLVFVAGGLLVGGLSGAGIALAIVAFSSN